MARGALVATLNEEQQQTLAVVTPSAADNPRQGGPPGGLLLLLLAPGSGADAANLGVLRALSSAQEAVARRCWGLTTLQVSDCWSEGWAAALRLDAEPAQPSHADLVAFRLGVTTLPALLLLSCNGKNVVQRWPREAAPRDPLEIEAFFSEDVAQKLAADRCDLRLISPRSPAISARAVPGGTILRPRLDLRLISA